MSGESCCPQCQRQKSAVDEDLLWLAGVGVGHNVGGVGNNVKGLVDGQIDVVAVATHCYFHAEVYRNITATMFEPISSSAGPLPSSSSPHDLINTPKGLENEDVRGDTRGEQRGDKRRCLII